jgi:hypothetical protein
MYLCIICLRDYFSNGSQAKLALFALLAYGAFGLKSSMGLQIGAAALATGLAIAFYGRQRRQGWSLVIVSAATLEVMLFDITVIRSGVGSTLVKFAPLNHFYKTLENLGMSGLAVDWYIPMFVLVLLAGLGVRALGLLYLGNRISKENPRDWNWILVFIGLFFVGGYAISEMLFIGDSTGLNNAGWFYIQSLMASWFLLFLFLIKIQGRKRVYLASIIAIVVLATPSTVQFLHLRADDNYIVFGQDETEVIEYLRQSDPGSVVLHPLNHDRPSLASNFAGRSTVLSVWVSFVTEAQGKYERAKSVLLFFDKGTNTSERLEVLYRYRVDYVYGSTSELFFMENFPEAELVLQSGDLVLYRVFGH